MNRHCCSFLWVLLLLGWSLNCQAQETRLRRIVPGAGAGSLPGNALQQPVGTIRQTLSGDVPMTVRVKDVAKIEGVRDNQLLGYGIVVGLNRTGDRVQQNLYTRQTMQNLLERMGISVNPNSLKPENMATVLLTATLPPFVRQGSKIDVTVSSLADAKSLAGGTLILAELKGIDGQVYALAQGPLSVGGLAAGSRGNSVEINHPTVGRIPNGALVERTVATTLGETLTLVLDEADFTTAFRLQKAINLGLGCGCARAVDARTVEVRQSDGYLGDPVGFIAALETLPLQVDTTAKVIINERTGTIVMGRHVKLSPVAISQGGITVRVGTELEVSQPTPFSDKGETVVTPRTTVKVEQNRPQSVYLPEGSTVDEIVRGLRAVGTTTNNIISILQAIKAAGALNAILEVQ